MNERSQQDAWVIYDTFGRTSWRGASVEQKDTYAKLEGDHRWVDLGSHGVHLGSTKWPSRDFVSNHNRTNYQTPARTKD